MAKYVDNLSRDDLKETYWRTEVYYTGSSLYSQLMKLWRGGEYNGVSRLSVVGET